MNESHIRRRKWPEGEEPLPVSYTHLDVYKRQALLRALIEKYTVEETAAVHAVLMRKCQAGDMDAIRLWNDMQKESGSGVAEVNIVDSI